MSGGLPEVKQDYFPLGGGLDLQTPAIALPPGAVIDAQNFETDINGGYRSMDGFERFDGHASPSGATYWTLSVTTSGTFAVGATVTGATSAATGKVLSATATLLILGRVTGTFASGENLTVAAVVQGVTTSLAVSNGSSDPAVDSTNALLAANDLRNDIAVVPGSGAIRGVFVYNDVVYAFRDNAGGTAGNLYKSTITGWQQVTFGNEIQFTAATGQINAGDTITGGTSGATALVVIPMLRAGSWTVAGVGTLIISTITGTWQNGEAIKVAAVSKATSSSLATAIARQPGGRVETDLASFSNSTGTKKIYGADGVNFAFEFDGANYVPIRTGMTSDNPTHVIVHRYYLFLSFRASVQLSAITNPYAWSVVLGAGEFGTGDDVTNFVTQGGTAGGSALAVFTKGRTFVLYGSSTTDFNLVPSVRELGYSAYTAQPVSNNTYGLTARGIQSLITTLTYGDFDYSSISHNVTEFLKARQGLEIASTTFKIKNHYRLYFSDGYCLQVGLTGDKVNGLMPLNYGKPVRCITTVNKSDGTEVTFFGSDDGYVYQDAKGTSFDGTAIEGWVRLPFTHSKSPQVRKRYRRAVLEARANGYAQVFVSYELGYSNPGVLAPAILPTQTLTGGGGYWDQVSWDAFIWDSQVVSNPRLPLTGVEKNISLLFYKNSASDKAITLQGVTLFFTPQRAER